MPLKKAGEPSGRNLRSEIVVCNYDSKSHPDVWIDFRSWINKPAITLGNCPRTRTRQAPSLMEPVS